jgi:hydrogenase-4 component E
MNFNFLAWVSLLIVMSNLYLLTSSRLPNMIRGVATQGLLLSFLPLLLPNPGSTVHVIILFILSASIKGVIIPAYLFKSIRDVRVTRETNPTVSYFYSVIFGVLTTVGSFFVLRNFPFASSAISPFHVITAISTAFVGLFLIVARRNIVSQIIGYLVFENAGFILGISIAASQPLFIEMGVLLDILACVIIMVMVVNRVHAEHDSLNIGTLEKLTR